MTAARHRAGWVMRSPGSWLADGTVTVAEGRVVAVDSTPRVSDNTFTTDHGPGVIMPALVNAHTHLSLSALAGKIETGEGFLPWVRKLVEVRRNLSLAAATAAMEAAVNRLRQTGVALVGEFGSHIPVAPALAAAGIAGTIWLEFLGNDQDLPFLPLPVGEVDFAYAGHAPHTASPSLLQHLKETDRRLRRRFSLHLAESKEEVDFLATGKGEWAGFLREMGRDFSGWGFWGRRPVELAARLGLLDGETLAVHCLLVTPEEIQLLARSGSHLCLCPRSNWSLHGRVPDIPAFLEAGMAPALGTDSLASTESLSMFDEMRFVAGRYPMLSPDTILAMATVNGARALGRPDLGTVSPGQTARLIYVDLEAATGAQAAERLVSGPVG
ncbi:MAG TPA: amidohydrolase family protein, partial [Syntrophobacteria bacterium]|nr:amidohydrolase family protein [Syntrophobacteria bacterium]